MIPRVAYLPCSDDGCGFYRMFLPHLHTEDSKYIFKHPLPYQDIMDCQIGIVQRLATEENIETLVRFKEIGLKLIYDLDDNLWDIPGANPAKKKFKSIPRVVEGFRACAEVCDVMTVSTNSLKTSVQTTLGLNNVEVVPNGVDFDLFKPTFVKKSTDEVTVGWAGSNTHSEDLMQMGNALAALFARQKNIRYHFVGMNPVPKLTGHNRVLVHTWVPVRHYPARFSTWDWDIALAPLADNRFNRSKSNIKMLEAATLRRPCLASKIQPYLEFVAHDKELEFLICDSPNAWLEKLELLVQDKIAREHYGNKMYEVAKEYYDMEVVNKKRYEIFERLVS